MPCIAMGAGGGGTLQLQLHHHGQRFGAFYSCSVFGYIYTSSRAPEHGRHRRTANLNAPCLATNHAHRFRPGWAAGQQWRSLPLHAWSPRRCCSWAHHGWGCHERGPTLLHQSRVILMRHPGAPGLHAVTGVMNGVMWAAVIAIVCGSALALGEKTCECTVDLYHHRRSRLYGWREPSWRQWPHGAILHIVNDS